MGKLIMLSVVHCSKPLIYDRQSLGCYIVFKVLHWGILGENSLNLKQL